jgi:hypothetical protein
MVYSVLHSCKSRNIDTKELISKTTLTVIPACPESFLKKDAGQASMTE